MYHVVIHTRSISVLLLLFSSHANTGSHFCCSGEKRYRIEAATLEMVLSECQRYIGVQSSQLVILQSHLI